MREAGAEATGRGVGGGGVVSEAGEVAPGVTDCSEAPDNSVAWPEGPQHSVKRARAAMATIV